MARPSRRRFLENTMLVTAAAWAAEYAATKKPLQAAEASSKERLSVCVMGVRGRGGSHLGAFAGRKDTFVSYVCDVDRNEGAKAAESVGKRQGEAPKFEEDIRKVLEDKTVDIVSIATPNHWHALGAIWAMQAGKDVYVEKPVSHNVSEGRRAVEAARKYNKICQTGTQSRSSQGLRDAVEFVRSGKLGAVKVGRGLCYKPRGSIGAKVDAQAPSNVNYDLWSGPAPMHNVTRPQFHYDWHWQWDYGNGDLGNQGIHQMDIARWFMGQNTLSNGVISYGGRFGYVDAGETPNTQIVMHDYGAQTLVFEVRGLKTDAYKGAGVGVIVECEGGYLVIGSYEAAVAFDPNGKEIAKFAGGGDHFENFLKAVRSRNPKDLHADIEEGHLSSALCHLGNISYRLGSEKSPDATLSDVSKVSTHDNFKDTFERTIAHLDGNKVDTKELKFTAGPALAFDPKTETFPGNDAANKMLTREYRKPFVVPGPGEV